MLFTSIASLALLSSAALTTVTAQSPLPDVSTFPAACASDQTCGDVVKVGVLCTSQYKEDTAIAACFCNAGLEPTTLSQCSTCLTSNSAPTLGSTLAAVATTCDAALKSCAFSCDFETCKSDDVACQCGGAYLQNILDCASCNSANGNTGATLISDYEALRDSCVNQNYTQTPTATEALPSPTGQDSYVAPTLTGKGDAVEESSASIQTTAAVTTKVAAVTTTATTAASSSTSGASRMSSSSSPSSSSSGSAAPPANSASAGIIGAKSDVYAAGVVVSLVLGVVALF